ncbi:hypothetical protein CRENBAI_017605 [Crenichthys baileyi]|uniref:Uncharacterized protein n=1 Tax=Crenichthys baileyi TaxID=28760 RepID=A0AAV9S4L6_9TELE
MHCDCFPLLFEIRQKMYLNKWFSVTHQSPSGKYRSNDGLVPHCNKNMWGYLGRRHDTKSQRTAGTIETCNVKILIFSLIKTSTHKILFSAKKKTLSEDSGGSRKIYMHGQWRRKRSRQGGNAGPSSLKFIDLKRKKVTIRIIKYSFHCVSAL